MKNQKATPKKKPAAQTASRDVVYVAYNGNSPLSLPAPGHGFSFVFEPLPVKNRIETAAWAELSDPKKGSARVYINARKLRKTGRGDAFDKVKDVRKIAIVKAELPQVATADTSKDALIAQLQANLASQTANNERLAARLSELEAQSEQPEVDEILDPGKLSIPKLAEAISDLDVDDLEAIKLREENGKNRPKARAAIEAAIDRALGDDAGAQSEGGEQG